MIRNIQYILMALGVWYLYTTLTTLNQNSSYLRARQNIVNAFETLQANLNRGIDSAQTSSGNFLDLFGENGLLILLGILLIFFISRRGGSKSKPKG